MVFLYGKKPGDINIFGHLDVCYGNYFRTYGPFNVGGKKSNFLVAEKNSYLNMQKSSGRKIDKLTIRLNYDEFIDFRNFYSSLIKKVF